MKKLIILILVFWSVQCSAAQFLIKVPIEQKLKTQKIAALEAVYARVPLVVERIPVEQFQVTDDLLFNTKVVGIFKLINLVEDISIEDLQVRIDKFKLGWVIFAANDGYKIVDGERVVNQIKQYNSGLLRPFLMDTSEPYKLGKFIGAVPFEPITNTVTIDRRE